MKKTKRNTLLILALSTTMIITTCTFLMSKYSLNQTLAAQTMQNFDLKILPETPGVPSFSENNEGKFTIYTTSGNPVTFRYRGFGKKGDALALNNGNGYIYNVTPLNGIKKITHPEDVGLVKFNVKYGYYETNIDYDKDYEIIGNITYGMDIRQEGFTNDTTIKDGLLCNVFKIDNIRLSVDKKFKNITVNYNCAQ